MQFVFLILNKELNSKGTKKDTKPCSAAPAILQRRQFDE